ncbi:MAG TPA: hypothetical protein VFV68_07630 [Agriterribacter sp.]|nr:hypothetical protein [Agriterribacter sp.]
MKQIFCIIMAGLIAVGVPAQNEKYVKAMETAINQLDTTRSEAGLTALSNTFQRIGDAEKTQWLPYYYAAFSLTMAGWSDARKDKDANAEKIKALCDKAEALDNNSEICAIRNMAATQQMLVDPQTRWMTYGQEADAALKNGMQLDPSNPRLYYLEGAGIFNTPKQFGGGKTKAKPVLEKSLALFNAEKTKPLHPNWSKKQAEDMLAQCN